MGCYKVNFGDYCLAHYDSCKYFDYFEFNGDKYPIGAHIELTAYGMSKMYYNNKHGYIKGDFRLVDYYITENGKEEWKYIIGKSYNSNMPFFYSTRIRPDELISEVLCEKIDETIYTTGELEVDFQEPNYFPKDDKVDGMILGWIAMIIVWIGAFIFKDWWIRLVVQIVAGFYFGSWRDKKISEAISNQNFKR